MISSIRSKQQWWKTRLTNTSINTLKPAKLAHCLARACSAMTSYLPQKHHSSKSRLWLQSTTNEGSTCLDTRPWQPVPRRTQPWQERRLCAQSTGSYEFYKLWGRQLQRLYFMPNPAPVHAVASTETRTTNQANRTIHCQYVTRIPTERSKAVLS